MTVNPHISKAIQIYAGRGLDFHEVMTWHLLHGVVVISPEFICLAHYCQKDDIYQPLPLAESNTSYVTYFGGDMRELKAITPEKSEFIAFERQFKDRRGVRIHCMDKFKQLIH